MIHLEPTDYGVALHVLCIALLFIFGLLVSYYQNS